MAVLDIGCGPGFFTLEIARLAGPEGNVVAADLQQGNLAKTVHALANLVIKPKIRLLKFLQQ